MQFNEANLSQARNNLGSVNEQIASQPLPLVSALQHHTDFPQLEVIKFDGEPSKYAKFESTFQQTVGAAILSVNKKLLDLLQHCQGKAKQLIERFCLLNSQEGYEKALQLLKEKYGRSNVIARSYCERLTQGSPIKSDNCKGLDDLAQLLEESEVTLNCLNYQVDLNNFNTMSAIVKRLPFSLQSRWLRTVAEFEKRGIDAKFKIFVKFVKDEAEISNSSFASVVNQRNKRKGGSTFFANSDKPKVTPLNRNRADQKKCVYYKDKS